MKRDFIIFQLAGIAVLREVEVGDGQLWLALASAAGGLVLVLHHIKLIGLKAEVGSDCLSFYWFSDCLERLIKRKQFQAMVNRSRCNHGIWQLQFARAAQRYGQILHLSGDRQISKIRQSVSDQKFVIAGNVGIA
jgi:uncharacterized membrane protein YfbV (UPF0208 family)